MARKTNDELLRSAITDAKTVRESAIANARIMLEEAFTPQISSMLSRKLRTELDEPAAADGHGRAEGGETDEKAVTEVENPDTSSVGAGDNKQPSSDSNDSSTVGKNPESKTVDLSEADEPTAADGHGKAEGGETDEKAITEDEEFDIDGDEGNEEFSDEDEEDLDLEAVIRELEGEDQEDQSDIATNMTPDATQTVDSDLKNLPEDEDADVDFDSEDEFSSTETPSDDTDIDIGDIEDDESSDDEEELDLEEILREMEASNAVDQATDPEFYNKVTSENAQLKRDLKEHRNVIEFLREKLQEVNMLNAKLLYTNKLFRSNNLNLSEKQRVIETFDRATTLREVKLVYSTLAESIKSSGKRGSKSITEGLASRSTGGSTVPKSPTILTEVKTPAADEQLRARMKKLAGIR